MKKTLVMGAAICAVFAMTSCKSKESAYKKAYEKAKAQQTAVVQPTTPVQTTTPVTTVTTVTPQQTAPANDYSNVNVRTENVTLISGSALKAYSVVVGSFGVRANADGLQQRLKDAGYDAQIVKNEDKNMFRVVASTYNDKGSAAASRDQLRATYPDAWLLYFGQ